MAICKTLKRQNRSLCAGDLRSKIIIKEKAITPSSTGTVDFTETYTTSATVWAMIMTDSYQGEKVFDSTMTRTTGSTRQSTHKFIIRYRAGLTAENVIEYSGKYYDILDITNVDEQNEYLQISCRLRGDKTLNINQT